MQSKIWQGCWWNMWIVVLWLLCFFIQAVGLFLNSSHTHTLASQWRPKILKTTVGAATVERCRFWLKVCVDSSRPVLKWGHGDSGISTWKLKMQSRVARRVSPRKTALWTTVGFRGQLLGPLKHSPLSGEIPTSEKKQSESEGRSAVSGSFWPHGLYSHWDSSGQNTGVGSRSLLQAIFPIQGLNPGLPHCRQLLCQLSPREAHPQARRAAIPVLWLLI